MTHPKAHGLYYCVQGVSDQSFDVFRVVYLGLSVCWRKVTMDGPPLLQLVWNAISFKIVDLERGFIPAITYSINYSCPKKK